jgi:hypothetical protein
MLIQASTNDKIQVITSDAGTVKVHASWVDAVSNTFTPGRTNTASITTAATTDVVAAPAASTQRTTNFLSVRNTDATVSQTITIQHTDGTTVEPIFIGIIAAGESVVMDRTGVFTSYASTGVIKSSAQTGWLFNSNTANTTGYAVDTYLVGSNILIPSQNFKAGTGYRCRISITKTAAGVVALTATLRVGANASTADGAYFALNLSAQTAATDTTLLTYDFMTRGTGASAALVAHLSSISQPTTGFSSLLKGANGTSTTDITAWPGKYIGVSLNGGASASYTVNMVQAEIYNI